MVVIYAIVVALWSLRVLMTWSECAIMRASSPLTLAPRRKPRSAENFAEFVSFLFASAMLGIGVVVVKVLNARDIGSTLGMGVPLVLVSHGDLRSTTILSRARPRICICAVRGHARRVGRVGWQHGLAYLSGGVRRGRVGAH